MMKKERKITGGQKMTIRQVAEQLGCHPETIKGYIRELFPGLMVNGITTYLTEAHATVILEKMKAANSNQFNLQRSIAGIETGLSRELRLAMLYKQTAELGRELRIEAESKIGMIQSLLDERETGLETYQSQGLVLSDREDTLSLYRRR